MISTRPTPPWVLVDHFAQTFLEKTITVRFGFATAPPPGELDVDHARDNIYSVPSTTWQIDG